MDIDFSQFSREDFKISGFRRAIVEDNTDPTKSGRLRVRIIGIHSLDGEETPVSHLPWAEPCMTLYTSGGFNVQNRNTESPESRYESGADGGTVAQDRPSRRETERRLIAEWQDQTTQNNGTGGIFTVPRKGTMVWVFFDGGDHNHPIYFGAAPRKLDWDTQFDKLAAEIQDKEQTLTDILDEMEALESSNQDFQGDGITANIQIKTPIIKPDLNFKYDDFNSNADPKDLTSWTSPGGMTFLAINDDNDGSNEKIFIMHKGYLEHVDQNGQRTILIGKTNTDSTDPLSPEHASGEGNDVRNFVANNSELYILGDQKVYVQGNSFFQCEKSVEINAKEEVGIFTREGNVNILANSADVNVESKAANFNIKSLNTQIQSDAKILIEGKEDIKVQSEKSIDFKAPLIQFEAEDQFTIKTGNMRTEVDDVSFEIAPTGFFVNASTGQIGLVSNDYVLKTDQTLQQKTADFSLQATEIKAQVDQKISFRSTDMALEATNKISARGNAEVAIGGASASFAGDADCFVGGAQTSVGGIVSLGSGQSKQTDPVVRPQISDPTKPKNPEDIPVFEFVDGSQAKDIEPTETNFSDEEA